METCAWELMVVLLATRKFDVLCIPVLAGCFVVWQPESFLLFAQSRAPSLFPDTASLFISFDYWCVALSIFCQLLRARESLTIYGHVCVLHK
jgi:hypothetical protein